jgi:hypothetical protein
VGASSRLKCPACGADVGPLSLSNVRRRRLLACNSCGAELAIVIPYGLYTLTTLGAVIAGSMLLPTILMSLFEKKWHMVALAIALLFAIIFGTNAFLIRRATVELAGKQAKSP